jgi:D-glycero-D-manno-heptose 1,7-bisphosphate phosphatase
VFAVWRPALMQRRLEAALLDRDGTINVKAAAGDYITDPEQLVLLPEAAEAIRRLNQAQVPVIVVTNQRGIALGRMSEDDLAAIHARLRELLRRQGAWIGRIYHCPHDTGICCCRKPGTRMLEQARDHLKLASLRDSVMIGDATTDVLAGRAAGARTILLSDGAEPAPRDIAVAGSLLEAVRQVLPAVAGSRAARGRSGPPAPLYG